MARFTSRFVDSSVESLVAEELVREVIKESEFAIWKKALVPMSKLSGCVSIQRNHQCAGMRSDGLDGKSDGRSLVFRPPFPTELDR